MAKVLARVPLKLRWDRRVRRPVAAPSAGEWRLFPRSRAWTPWARRGRVVGDCEQVEHLHVQEVRDADQGVDGNILPALLHAGVVRREHPEAFRRPLLGETAAPAKLSDASAETLELLAGVVGRGHAQRRFLGNLVWTAALAGAGALAYTEAGKNCSRSVPATTAAPNPPDRACTETEATDDKSSGQRWGIGLGAVAVVPLGILLINLAKASDDVETHVTPPQRHVSPWRKCSQSKPIANTTLEMKTGTVTLTAVTDEAGTASFQLEDVLDSAAEPLVGVVSIADGAVKAEPVKVSLTATRSYAAWVKRGQDERAAAAAEARSASAERAAQLAAEEAAREKALEERQSKVRAWATSAVSVAMQSEASGAYGCWNRAGFHVKCTSDGAVDSKCECVGSYTFVAKNQSRVNVTCKMGENTVMLSPGKSWNITVSGIPLESAGHCGCSRSYLGLDCRAQPRDLVHAGVLATSDLAAFESVDASFGIGINGFSLEIGWLNFIIGRYRFNERGRVDCGPDRIGLSEREESLRLFRCPPAWQPFAP